MRKLVMVLGLMTLVIFTPMQRAQAQIPIVDVIKEAIKKVIKAVDLEVQRLQNQTIWLQNAQKELENTMSQLKLNDIGDWVQKQKTLYQDYFDELSKVKTIIAYYQRIKDITEKQGELVASYKRAWSLVKQDNHFTADEINYIGQVYSGILDESIKNLDQITMVINSFTTQMTDAQRLEIINKAANKVDENYSDLQQFNSENALLSLQRARDANDAELTKALYGIQ